MIAGTAPARALDLTQGSYFGRRHPEDGRIDWSLPARAVHDLVRAVAPPFPGAFTEVNGCRLEIAQTRLDEAPARHALAAPCLYLEAGSWFADCVDGRRLRLTRLASAAGPVTPHALPDALGELPLRLR